MPKATANGLKISYEIRGSGPNLLFINGIGADMKTPIGLFNSPMVEHFTVLAYDPRGLGESEGPEAACTMADLAEDAAQLAKSVGWDKYHVFGASMGGMVAQELAIRHPDAVDKLVLAVTHSGGENGAPSIVDKMWDLSPEELLLLSDTRQDAAWAAAHPGALESMQAQTARMKAFFEADPSRARGYRNQAAAVLGHDTTARLHLIAARTLAFNGKYDGGVPVAAAKIMAERIGDCRFELVEHGHGSWFFDPDVWEMVVEFLQAA
ncbi:MAG: alpha/beta hydrolase [Bacillota bacterium]